MHLLFIICQKGCDKMFDRFIFDNIPCNEYGVTCVSFSSPGMETISAQESELETEKSIRGDIFHITSHEYIKPLTFTIQIVNKDFSPISAIQERALKKWMCQRGKYKPFCIYDKRYADTWFFANINNPKSIYICDTVGLEFTVTTNAPFGFSDIRNKRWILEGNDTIKDLYVDNDEELPIYPTLTITTSAPGTLNLTNQSLVDVPNTLTIDNCVADEVLTLECGYPHISSSIPSHKVFDDFNKFWLYLVDGYNRIAVSIPCTIELQYREYRKVGIV